MTEPIYKVEYPEGERSTLTIEVTLAGKYLCARAWLDTPGWDRAEWGMTTEQMLAALAEARKKLAAEPESLTCFDCHGKGYGEGFTCGPGGDTYGKITCYRCQGSGRMPFDHVEPYQRGRELRAKRIERHESMRTVCERLAIPGLGMAELSAIECGRWDKVDRQLLDAVFEKVNK